MVLDVVVANTYVTDNNDQFTQECLQDIADNINKEPHKFKLFDSLSGTREMGEAIKAKFDGKRLHVYFNFLKPFVSFAGNLPGEQGLLKPDAYNTLVVNKLEDVRFGFTANSSFRNAHGFKVSGSVCSKCYNIDVTEEDDILEDDEE